MSLNGMAESRRLWCYRRVWLKCSKTVARQSQVLPVRACSRLQRGSQDNPASPSAIARILYRGPGKARLPDLLPPAPNRGRAGRRGSKRTHGPRRLATSRLVEVLVPRLSLWFERSAKRAASPPNPRRPARGVLGLLRTLPGGRISVAYARSGCTALTH